MSKKFLALMIAIFMVGTLASAATMIKDTKTTITTVGSKETKTVMKKHFKRTSKKNVKSTVIKSTTTSPNPATGK